MPRRYDNPQEPKRSGRYVGRYERLPAAGKGKKKKKTGLIVLCVILVLLAIVAAAGVILYNSVLDKITYVDVPKIQYTQPPTEAAEDPTENTASGDETTAATEAETTAATEPHVASREDYINFLLVGQAAREGAEERFADTMILCTINTHEKTLTITSILRDSYARRPAWTDFKGVKHTAFRDKLTKVYHMGSYFTAQSGGNREQQIAGSMELMNLALYDNFGIEVDYNFEVDFDIFTKLIDLLGGLPIELTEAEAAHLNRPNFDIYFTREISSGPEILSGIEALSYARMRKAEGDGDSDINRTQRQRNVIASLLKTFQKKGVSKAQEIANELLPLVITSMNKSEISDMMVTMLKILPELKIVNSGTCPVEYKGDLVDVFGDGNKHSVLLFNETTTKKYMRALTLGEGEIPTE